MSHDLLQAIVIFAAGLAAGTINTVVGSGTLVTFPTLLAFGYPPVLANVSNNVGLVPGVASGVHGYRAELGGQRRRIIRLGSASLLGGLVGAFLLLVLPAGAFKAIVPVLIGIALVMVVFQPRLSKFVAARQRARGVLPAEDAGTGLEAPPSQVGGPVLWTLVFLSGVYGGYFGAAQGVLLLGMLLHVGTGLLLARIVRRLFGELWGWTGGALWLVNPFPLLLDLQGVETPFYFLALALVIDRLVSLILRHPDEDVPIPPSTGWLATLGAFLGLAFLGRSEAIVMATGSLLLLAWMLRRTGADGEKARVPDLR